MTAPVFGDYAREFWSLGYSVIPLEPNTKRPAKEIENWSGYNNNLPSPDIRVYWLEEFADPLPLCIP